MTPPLAHKHALITGASSGLGRAIGEALAARGAGLFLVGRRLDTLESAAAKWRQTARFVEVHPADLTVDTDLHALVRSLEESGSAVDFLIHSAGIICLGPVETSPISEFDAQYRCNVRAPYLLTQALLPMLKQQRGQVVFVNSTAGLNPQANCAAYAASKHALKALADSLRAEVNAAGIRVISIFPGRSATPMQEQIFQQEGKPYRPEWLLQPEDVAETVVHLLQLPPTAEVTDIVMRPAVKSY
jgi:short-subunit dehydrogenase